MAVNDFNREEKTSTNEPSHENLAEVNVDDYMIAIEEDLLMIEMFINNPVWDITDYNTVFNDDKTEYFKYDDIEIEEDEGDDLDISQLFFS